MTQKKPKILILDIETLPIEAYIWQTFDISVPIDMIKQDYTICSFSAKFKGEKKIHNFNTFNQKNIRYDKALLQKAIALIESADVICSQNGIKFDMKKIRSRAWANHLPPTQFPQKHVDLLVEGRKVFGHTSHKLAWISEKLDSTHKKSSHSKFPGFELWKQVMLGNKTAQKEMVKYNDQDIVSTEAVYNDYIGWFPTVDLRPFFMKTKKSSTNCRACGSINTVKWSKIRLQSGLFQKYRCNDCGCITTLKGAKNNLDKKESE